MTADTGRIERGAGFDVGRTVELGQTSVHERGIGVNPRRETIEPGAEKIEDPWRVVPGRTTRLEGCRYKQPLIGGAVESSNRRPQTSATPVRFDTKYTAACRQTTRRR